MHAQYQSPENMAYSNSLDGFDFGLQSGKLSGDGADMQGHCECSLGFPSEVEYERKEAGEGGGRHRPETENEIKGKGQNNPAWKHDFAMENDC